MTEREDRPCDDTCTRRQNPAAECDCSRAQAAPDPRLLAWKVAAFTGTTELGFAEWLATNPTAGSDLETPATAFGVIQEGGSSSELYLSSFSSEEEALDFRRDCTRDGAFRTSFPIEIPAELNALGEVFYSVLDDVLSASTDDRLECWDDGQAIDGDEDDEEEEEAEAQG